MSANILACLAPAEEPVSEGTDEVALEVNYDSNDLTYLYQAIEDKAFMAAIDYLESGKPEVSKAVRTWVTRFEEEDTTKIRWSQLPIHAALVFKAPVKLIELLVDLYPKGVRCTDDRAMLPLHLAFRHGASDNTLHVLLKEFPDAITAKDSRGREPLDFSHMGDSWKKGEIISSYLSAKGMAVKDDRDRMTELQGELAEKERAIKDLEVQTETLRVEAEEKAGKVTELESKIGEIEQKEAEKAAAEEGQKAVSPSNSWKRQSARKSPTGKAAATTTSTTTTTTTTTKKKKGLGHKFKKMFGPPKKSSGMSEA